MNTIKKNLLFTALALFVAVSTYAQIEITPQAGYQVGSKYNFYDGYMKLKASGSYGVTVDFDINPLGGQIEFMYAFQNADLNIKPNRFSPEIYITNFNVHHIQVGFLQNFNDDEDLVPFGGMSAGMAIFSPQNIDSVDLDYDPGNRTKFEFGFTGGAKYFFTDRIGIRLQAQLLIPIEWGGVYYSNGGSVYTSGGSLLQLNFTGGLIVRLGE